MIEKPTWSIMRRTKWTNLTGICLNSHPPGWTQNTDLTNLNVTSERKTMDTGTRLGPAPLQGCAMHSSLLLRLQAENEQVPLCNSGHLNVFYETPRYEEYLSWSSTFSTVKKDLIALLFPGSRWACRFIADVRRRISSLRKRPFLLPLRGWGRFARRKRKTRNVPSGEEGGETDVFAGYRISQGGETESLIGREK